MAALLTGLAVAVAGCSVSQPRQKAEISNVTQFSQAETGVKASPRITEDVKVAKGGGRYIVGKAYRVRGKWYKPRENPQYAATGMASWYGPNFHGRLTANGEIYDQYSLSAAHPTMPLPSYARVTNLENGRSVMVRVNDRGPFAHGRIIDMSARAAKLLDFAGKGVAKVRVEYAGKARMDGRDESFLMASYRGPDVPGIAPPGLGGATMVALHEDEAPVGSQQAAGSLDNGAFTPPGVEEIYAGSVQLASVPIPTLRPTNLDGIALELAQQIDFSSTGADAARMPVRPLGYAEDGARIASAFGAAGGHSDLSLAELARREVLARQAGETVVISLGDFAHSARAVSVGNANADLGVISVRRSLADRGGSWQVRLLCGADAVAAVLSEARSRGLEAAVVLR